MDFELRDDGFYKDDENGNNIARIQWEMDGDVMVMTHTVVDSSLQGQGVAGQLLDKAVEYAQENDYKMRPVCSYVQKKLDSVPGGKELRVD